MEKKQTAVEWLYERLERMIPREALYNMDKKQYFEQAKQMEKEQMKEAALNNVTTNEKLRKIFEIQFENYYNETYGGQDE
jgi:hypothetical protein